MMVKTRIVCFGSLGSSLPMLSVGVVVVDLPENALAVVLEGSEVALAVRIVVGCERVEGLDLLTDRRLIFRRLGR